MRWRPGPALVVLTLALAAPAAGPDTVAEQARRTRDYLSAARGVLEATGIDLFRVDRAAGTLRLDYRVQGEDTDARFALVAVLRLMQPLAEGMDSVEVAGLRGQRRLLHLSLPPQRLADAIASSGTAADLARAEELAAEVAVQSLAPAGAPTADAPAAAPGSAATTTVAPAPTAPQATPDPASRTTAPATLQLAAATPQAAPPAPGDADELAGRLLDHLIRADLENVTIALDAAGRWVVGFENRTWRSDLHAVAAALEAIAQVLPPSPLLLEMRRDGVAVSHLELHLSDWANLEAGALTPERLSAVWNAGPGPAEPAGPVRRLAAGNRSYLRTDISLRPELDYKLGGDSDPFESDLFVIADTDTPLLPGVSLNLSLPTRLTSGFESNLERGLLTWTGRPFDGLLGTVSAGKFRDVTFGYYGEVQWDAEPHRVGLVGAWTAPTFNLSPTNKWTQAVGYYEHDWGELGLTSRLAYGQYREIGERGFSLSLRRRVGESVLAAEAVRTDSGREGLNFSISVPLGPRRAGEPSLLRLRTDTHAGVSYRSNRAARGDYLQGPQDLTSFRGELGSAYVQAHPERLLSGHSDRAQADWPAAMSFEGTSGLLRIPTADVMPDGSLAVGISYMGRERSKVKGADTDAMPVFVGMGFLPNLEMAGRLTIFHDVEAFDWGFNMDRSMNIHYRLTRQRERWLPAVAVGVQDVGFGTELSYLGDSKYVVGSWQWDNWRLHLGGGSGRLGPVFGGADLDLTGDHKMHLLLDFDGDYLNGGARLFLGDWGEASVGLLGFEELGGSVVFHTDLP